MPYASTEEHGAARVLHLLCDISAAIGCLILLGMAGITVVSVVGRALFAAPIQGDVELVQLGGAVCVACFLPFTQFKGANIIVDFFTQNVRERTRSRLDALGTGLYAAVLALICWRGAAGGIVAHENGETSMLMALPIWIAYAAMLPGLALSAVVGLWQTAGHLRTASAS